MVVKKGYADIEDGQIHYRRTHCSSMDSTIVLLHQAPSSSRMFEPALESFTGQFDAIAPDIPGFGFSYTPWAVPAIVNYSRVLWHFIDALNVESFHVVGHHTGASIAVEMAAERPNRIDSVSLIGPPYLSDSEREQRLAELDEEVIEPPIDDTGTYLLDHWHLFDDEGDDLTEQHQLVVDSLLARGTWVRTYRAVWKQDFPALFDDISVPRMIMSSRDDALWEGFLQARDAHPEVRAVELDGGNYEPLFDVEGFTNALTSFVAATDE